MNNKCYLAYNKLRIKYVNTIIFIYDGDFIRVYDDDALIINSIMGYELCIHDSYLSVGFPEKSYSKVVNELIQYGISYYSYKYNELFKNNNCYSKYLDIIKVKYELNKKVDNMAIKIKKLYYIDNDNISLIDNYLDQLFIK
ncbi:MAG TPA: hypothetical protein PLB45_04755 [Bacilli bacterium]|nr:hypothetical protein [Bacilli bacterium]HQC84156.1 hypothetical protein [Bacilli bacterium]